MCSEKYKFKNLNFYYNLINKNQINDYNSKTCIFRAKVFR